MRETGTMNEYPLRCNSLSKNTLREKNKQEKPTIPQFQTLLVGQNVYVGSYELWLVNYRITDIPEKPNLVKVDQLSWNFTEYLFNWTLKMIRFLR